MYGLDIKTNLNLDEVVEMGILTYLDSNRNFCVYQIFQQSIRDAMEMVQNGFRKGSPEYSWFQAWNGPQIVF